LMERTPSAELSFRMIGTAAESCDVYDGLNH